jgi:hypothetical protein
VIYQGSPFDIIVEGRGEPHEEEREYGKFLMPQNVYQPTDVGFGQSIPELIMHDGMKPVRRGGEHVVAPAHLKESGEHHAWALIEKFPAWKNLGVFIADHETGPTKEEIKKATALYTATMRREFLRGKALWQRFKQPQAVDDRPKLAARLLHENVEWAGTAESDTKIPCPNCAEMVHHRLVYHKTCDFVLDEERAQELHVGPYAARVSNPVMAAKVNEELRNLPADET